MEFIKDVMKESFVCRLETINSFFHLIQNTKMVPVIVDRRLMSDFKLKTNKFFLNEEFTINKIKNIIKNSSKNNQIKNSSIFLYIYNVENKINKNTNFTLISNPSLIIKDLYQTFRAKDKILYLVFSIKKIIFNNKLNTISEN